MAAMTTALTIYDGSQGSRVYVTPGHTAAKRQRLIQRRKEAVGGKTVMEDTIIVQFGTTDVDGVLLPQNISATVTVARPVGYNSADMSSLLALFRELVASDNFGNVIDGQVWLQG